MARSDLLLSLVKAGVQEDRNLFRRTVDAIIAEERAKQHNVLAEQLEEAVKKNGVAAPSAPIMELAGSHQNLLHEILPQRNLNTLVLSGPTRKACDELIEEQRRSDLLRSHNVEPRHRLLLIGPPGNGKTCLAEAIAEALALPLLVVRYEGIIGSFLGETASRLQKLFEHVSTRPCVLFFDEFDTLGKERGDTHDTGEIKRVVSSLLLQIDRLPSYVVVVGATNHQELLDRAVWRRFQLRIELPRPTTRQVTEWFLKAADRWKLPADISPNKFLKNVKFESFAELEDFSIDLIRRVILAQGQKETPAVLAERIEQWKTRAQKKRG